MAEGANSGLVVSTPDPALTEPLDGLEGVEVIEWDLSGSAPRTTIDLVVVPYLSDARVLGELRGVATRLVQGQMLGYDGVAEALPPGVVFANAASVHETSTAELVLALILASQRGLDGFVRAALRGSWEPGWRPSLADRTVLLLGYGGVGRAIEARLEPFEVTIVRVAAHARTDERGEVHGSAELPELLGEADVVVVAVPLGAATTGMVDDSFLSRMRDGSLLVNVARGRVADTEALVAHARTGRIRLALDVTDPEPLPAGHELFSLPNVIITPHVGGLSTAMGPRMARLLAEQVARLKRGEEPLNVVVRT